MGVGIALGFLAVSGVFLLPFCAKFGSIEDGPRLLYRFCESRNSLLAGRSKRAFIRMLDCIRMGATVAGSHNDFLIGTEFARDRVERMNEGGTCHKYLAIEPKTGICVARISSMPERG